MANRYWVGGAASWDGTAGSKWALTSGGTGGEAIPTSSDDVFFDANSGTVTVTIAAGNTGCLSLTCTGFTGTLAGSAALNIRGSFLLVSGMAGFTYTGALTFSATDSRTLTFGTKATASATTFNGSGGTWTVQDAWNNGASNITVTTGTLDTNGQTLTCGAFSSSGSGTRGVTFGASAVNVSGTWSTGTTTNLTFSAGTSIITYSSGNTFAGGGLTFYELRMTFTGAAALISGANTFTNFSRKNIAQAGASLYIGNSFTVSGTIELVGQTVATQRLYVGPTVLGTQITITCNTTVTITNADFEDIVGAGSGTWSGTSIGNGGNCSGITFTTPVTRYWVHGANAAYNFKGGGVWSATSGGAIGASDPIIHDNVIFDANSFPATGKTVTMNGVSVRFCKNFDASAATNDATISYGNNTANMYGDFKLAAGMTVTIFDAIHFRGREASTIDTGTVSLGSSASNLYFTPTGTTCTLASALTTTGDIEFGALRGNDQSTGDAGTFDLAGFAVTTLAFKSNLSNTRTLTMGASTVTLTGTGTVWNFATVTGLTLNANTSTIKITDTSATARTFAGGGKTYNNFYSNAGAGTASLTISGSNTFADFKDDGSAAHSILFTAGTTQTVATFTVSGASGAVITINSTTTGVHNLVKTGGGTINRDWLNIQHSIASPAITWYAGTNSTDNQGVATAGRGWIFTAAPAGVQPTFFPFFARNS